MDMSFEEYVGHLYTGVIRLRKEGRYQEEYDALSVLISILSEDRAWLLQKHGDKINV